MQQQRQREQEKVLKLKAQNQSLSIEVGTLNDRIKELSQKICDTRVGVSNVKTVIDGMRTTRDTQMTEMAQLKARVKEQNARLVQLSQEKAKLDAKTKNADGSVSQESQAVFNSKQVSWRRRSGQRLSLKLRKFLTFQVIIKQLQDKLENLRSEIEAKTADINTNTEQLTEVKEELATLIKTCEELYADYDTQRIQVLELKHNRKNVSMTAAWDTTNSWGADEPTTVAKTATTNYAETVSTPVAATPGAAPAGYAKYRAIFEFQARNEDEITFSPGDIIMVPLENNAEPGWLGGEINGHTGWFPESYVEKMDEEFSYDPQNTNVDNNSTQLG
jgi:intersectin